MITKSSRLSSQSGSIDSFLSETRRFSASEAFKTASEVEGDVYERASEDFLGFWEAQARKLTWERPWTDVLTWERPYAKWFEGGQLNASVNCLDVHLEGERKNKVAILWEGEEGDVQSLTFHELHEKVNRLAFVLKHKLQVQRGDRVTIYLPLIPEAVISMLACARIGAIHSVVFAGFSAQSLKDRILDSGSKVMITAEGGYRRGKVVPLKSIVNQAVASGDTPMESILWVSHVGLSIEEPSENNESKVMNYDYTSLTESAPTYIEPEVMNSEDPLFILYTSGTTGKPKGIVHTTGGYLTHAKYSTRVVFDTRDDDVYWCTADVGWITGHTYLVYGPLSNGVTCFMYEGTPDYPQKDRFWQLIERHGVTIFYSAPTAIRCFMKWGDDLLKGYDLSTLRLLGSVGEPINPDVWVWYHRVVGGGRCPVVDTWWQTETGGIMIANIPALNDMKPGYSGLPLPGIEAKILTEGGEEVTEGGGYLSLTRPWPSMLRGVWGDSQRYESVYWDTFETYFSGDGAKKDADGYFMVMGRVDDVLNCAGHRIGTMEVESALVACEDVAEAAVVGMPDEIKGEAIVAFVVLEDGVVDSDQMMFQLIQAVSDQIGPIAKPKRIVFTPDLPKTRSGKIMRRILRALVEDRPVGDLTTLANPQIVTFLEEKV